MFKEMKKILRVPLFVFFVAGAFALPAKQSEAVSQKITVEKVEGITDGFMCGVDISSLYDVETHGGKFYAPDGKEEDLFKILKNSGVNWIRLRVWNKPVYEQDVKDKNGKVIAKKGEKYGGGNNSIEVDLKLAKRAKDAGLKLLVDFHYSDTWADPGKQNMPQEWKGLSAGQLENEVEKFTKESIEKFIKAGARPDAVQIGNELNSGFMWPLGQVWTDDKTVKIGGMKGFTRLLTRASKGVRLAENGGEKIKIVIHLANGGDQELYKWIFDDVEKAKVDYDIIGLSFYTYWHGSTDDLKANLEMLSKRYGKELAVVETAYAFTEEDGDSQGNVFLTYSDDNHGYVPSVQGQATAIRDVIATVVGVKGGCGVFYWEPAWLPVKGAGLSSTEGNTWENQNMFDFKGRALPSLNVWGLVKGKCAVENIWGGSAVNGGKGEIYAAADKLEVTVKPGLVPELPQTIKVIYSNDSESRVSVKWEKHDWKNEKIGKVNISGKIEGSAFKPVVSVNVSDITNVIQDPSFETGKLGKWKLNGPSAACFLENNKVNAKSGKWTYKYWLGSGFKSILTQEISDIPNGTYELSVWAMGGGGENNIRLFAANFDGTEKQITSKITNAGWNVWKQYKIKVPVTDGKATVGIYLDTNPDCWGNFDDVEFIKVED